MVGHGSLVAYVGRLAMATAIQWSLEDVAIAVFLSRLIHPKTLCDVLKRDVASIIEIDWPDIHHILHTLSSESRHASFITPQQPLALD